MPLFSQFLYTADSLIDVRNTTVYEAVKELDDENRLRCKTIYRIRRPPDEFLITGKCTTMIGRIIQHIGQKHWVGEDDENTFTEDEVVFEPDGTVRFERPTVLEALQLLKGSNVLDLQHVWGQNRRAGEEQTYSLIH